MHSLPINVARPQETELAEDGHSSMSSCFHSAVSHEIPCFAKTLAKILANCEQGRIRQPNTRVYPTIQTIQNLTVSSGPLYSKTASEEMRPSLLVWLTGSLTCNRDPGDFLLYEEETSGTVYSSSFARLFRMQHHHT